MIKTALFSLVILFTLSACQGRSMPTHPSLPEPMDLNMTEIKADLSKLKDKIKMPSFPNIPIVNKVIPKSSNKSGRLGKKKSALKAQSFSGGKVTDGLDMGVVRLGVSKSFSRIIFDSYKWEEGALPTERVNQSGNYIFTHEPEKRQITAIVDGYRAFSALVGDQSALYEGNPYVRTIRLEEYLDDSGFKFVIELKEDVSVYVYELQNPGRIIVDLIPQ
jgi:hypothetical protein